MAKKRRRSEFAAHLGMRILSWVHYVFGVLSLPLTLFSFAAGPGLIGARFRSVYPPMLAFMLSFSDMTIGVCLIALVVFRSLTEFFLGWRWRRKVLRTDRQTLTLVVSGGKILYALYCILADGFLTPARVNLFSFALNGVTFLLALRVHLRHMKISGDGPRTERNTEKDG